MESKTKTGAPWYCYCMKSATTATTTPSRADAAFLLLPLLLVLVLLGCCFVCTPWPANKDCGPVVVVTGGVSTTKGKNEKKTKIYKFRDRMSNQVASLTKQDKSLYVTLCLTCKQRLRPHVLFQGPPPHNKPYLQTKTAAPCVVPRPPPHNNPHLQTKTAAPCVVPRPPPTTTPHLQTKTAAPCVVPRPPPHNNPHLQTKTAAPCVVARPPPTTTPTCKQRLWPRVLFQGPPPLNNLLVVVEWYGTNGSYKQRLEPRGTATA